MSTDPTRPDPTRPDPTIPGQPGLRPSNADREPYEQALAQALADGRLDQETFEGRLVDVSEATSRAELDRSVRDVPFSLRAEQAEQAHRASRRRFVLGLAGLGLVGGGTFWATRQWPDPVRTDAPTATPVPAKPTVSSGSVDTTLVQVPVRQAEMFPIMVDHLLDEGMTRVSGLYSFDHSVNVDGIRDGRGISISYDLDRAPGITVHKEAPTRSFPTERVRDLDIAEVIDRTRKIIEVGPDPVLRIDDGDEWELRIEGNDQAVVWDLTGRRRIS